MATGRRNTEIANLLALSRSTIESHARNAYRKLQVHTRSQALACVDAERLLAGARCFNQVGKTGQGLTSMAAVVPSVVGTALQQVINSLSLLVVYGELLLRSNEVPMEIRERLARMFSDSEAVAPDLHLLYEHRPAECLANSAREFQCG